MRLVGGLALALAAGMAGCGSNDTARAVGVLDGGLPARDLGGTGGVAWSPPDLAQPPPPPDLAPPIPLGPPITAPSNAWTWVDIDGMTCADGSPTGVGVNLSDPAADVLIWFEGGGACWDGASCYGPVTTAFNLSGYGAAQMAGDAQMALLYPLNRSVSDNPFAHMNMVWVPYCTGDVFAGANIATLAYNGTNHVTHFVGYTNIGILLQRLVPTFAQAKTVWLAGDSAGGFGVALNFPRVQEAFAPRIVQVLDDSGQPIAPDPNQWAMWKNAWRMKFPPDCEACIDGPQNFVDYYRRKFPDNKFALISFEHDLVIAPFMNITEDQFNAELYAQTDHMAATWPNSRYFVLSGESHVGLLTPTAALRLWLTGFVTDDGDWTNQRP